MARRSRTYITDKQKADIWDRWERVDPSVGNWLVTKP